LNTNTEEDSDIIRERNLIGFSTENKYRGVEKIIERKVFFIKNIQ
jgi:hypothetical protein